MNIFETIYYKNDIKALESFKDIEVRNSIDQTPLIMACSHDRFEIVKYLVEKGANIEARDWAGSTPLIRAADNFEIVKYLVEKGANINAKNNNGFTALFEVCGNFKTVKYLVENGADVNVIGVTGLTPLIYVGAYDIEIAKFLVENGAEVSIKDEFNRTAIDYATEQEIKNYLTKLLDSNNKL